MPARATAAAARGFTLIELVAVLVLVSLLVAFAPLALDWLVAEKELEREVLQLGNIIEAVSSQAVMDRADYALHYDTEAGRWAMQLPIEIEDTSRARRGGDERDEPVKVLKLEENVPEEDLAWHALPKGISLKFFQGNRFLSGRYKVIFGWRGTVDPHILVFESQNVSSLDERDRARTVKVNFLGFPSYAPGIHADEMKKTDAELGR